MTGQKSPAAIHVQVYAAADAKSQMPCPPGSYNFIVSPAKSLATDNSKRGSALADLAARVTACELCPRLRTYCAEVARIRRRAYADWEYWGKPVPSFGDPEARVLVLGLAPGAHGSNRTGRPFTGDGSGNFLYPVLHATGFASQPLAHSRDDGMQMRGMWITSAIRCAPPGNKPLPEEIKNCAPFLDEEISLLPELRVVVCLGKIGFDSYVSHLLRTGKIANRKGLVFAHAAEYPIPTGQQILATYHPSLQNTNTGLLTRDMFQSIFERARALAGL
jgi:uracil-DNA glycosylase family 4